MRCKLCGRQIQDDTTTCACGNVMRRHGPRNRPPGPSNNANVRKRGAARRIKFMTWNGGFGSCHWCQRKVVCVASIPEQDRVSVSGSIVRWRSGEELLECLVATTDHLTAIADGGKNGRNIVVSCAPCNQARKSEKAKALEAEAARRNNAARKQLRWLLQVGASVVFGKPVSIEVRHEGEAVVRVLDDNFEVAVNQAMNLYGRWCMERLGKVKATSEGLKR